MTTTLGYSGMACLAAAVLAVLVTSASAGVVPPPCPRGKVYSPNARSGCVACGPGTVKVPDTAAAGAASCELAVLHCGTAQVAAVGVCTSCPDNMVATRDRAACVPCGVDQIKVPAGVVADATCEADPDADRCVYRGPEECNGIDDDCDGVIDEGTISCGIGACAREVPMCVTGRRNQCTPGTPQPEKCNGIDDNCNGEVDETYTTCGIGACQRKIMHCINGKPNPKASRPCVPGKPKPETCNGIDDNCNGEIDETYTFCGIGACQRKIMHCINGQPNPLASKACVPGQPQPETCNGIDDNCNGEIDETYTFCGVGACQRKIMHCINGQPNPLASKACVPGQPQPETCNGVDDDCDGVVDDNIPDLVCGRGSCAVKVPACTSSGRDNTCASAKAPAGSTCTDPTTITFDEFTWSSVSSAEQQAGLSWGTMYQFIDWTNFLYYRGEAWPAAGGSLDQTAAYKAYRAGASSKPNAARPETPGQMQVLRTTNGGDMDLLEVTATAIWMDELPLTFYGYREPASSSGSSGAPTTPPVAQKSFRLKRGVPARLALDFAGVNAVVVVPSHPAYPDCVLNPICPKYMLEYVLDDVTVQAVI